jgi:hypothetical protein
MGASLKKRKQFKLPDENEGNVDWVLGDWLENIVATDRTQKVCVHSLRNTCTLFIILMNISNLLIAVGVHVASSTAAGVVLLLLFSSAVGACLVKHTLRHVQHSSTNSIRFECSRRLLNKCGSTC